MDKKDVIQQQAEDTWFKHRRGTLAIATGVGKTRIALNILHKLYREGLKVILVVPTEKLRDKNWSEECNKWNFGYLYDILQRECYVNIHKIKDQKYDLVILDEAHCITELSNEFFKNNEIGDIVSLTATTPKDPLKAAIIESIAPVIFKYTLEEGLKDGIITPFKINVVDLVLDDKDKYIKAGTKEKPFLQTEFDRYNYLNDKVSRSFYSNYKDAVKFAILERLRFIYNLKTKTEAAKFIIQNIIPDDRLLIFAGSIVQAEMLCDKTFHSKSKDIDLTDFQDGKINRLSCVNALNQGINIANLDSAIITQVKSKDHHVIQQIGRVVRWREDHIANIWILRVLNTVDETWVNTALAGFDKSLINYIYYKNLV